MEESKKTENEFEGYIRSIPDTIKKVIINPVGFFKDMPKSGGFIEPLIFMVCMGLVVAVINLILATFGMGFVGSFLMAVASLIILPIVIAIFGFVGALILFIIWKIMGSQESFETAYRCAAYATGITPITTIINLVPYLGALVSLLWMTYLMVVASVEVHSINRKTAWMVFGIIAGIFFLFSISSQYAARKLTSDVGKFQEEVGKQIEDMSPEEAGKAMGEFLKGLQQSAE